MSSNNIRNAYKKWQDQHPNFITPELEKFSIRKPYVIELSSGHGTDNSKMFGVSVFMKDAEQGRGAFVAADHDLNKPFHDKTEARNYYELLRDLFQEHGDHEKVVKQVAENILTNK